MSKERKENRNVKKSGGNGRRPRRPDYVNTFEWGFVDEGGAKVDDIPDEDLFYGGPRSEDDFDDSPFDATKVVSPKRAKPSSRKGDDAPKQPPKSKESPKKSSPKSAAVKPLDPLDFEDDDDDLVLPSYGRTPIPKDSELPQRKEKPGRKEIPEKDRIRTPEKQYRERREEDDSDAAAAPQRPKREQMVWDPDKREYVPLIVSERKAPKRESARKEPAPQKTERKLDDEVSRTRQPETPKRKSEAREERPARESRTEKREQPAKPMVSERKQRPPEERPVRQEKPATKAKPEPQRREPAPPRVEKEARKSEPKQERKSAPKPERDRLAREPKVPERDRFASQRGEMRPHVESNRPNPEDAEADPKGFAELGVSETMLEALKIVRYLAPTPIQSGVFKQVQAGKDIMGQAQTGTGKTAAFSIPIIEGVENCPPGNDPVALILVPTRELAVQVRDEAHRLAYGRDIRVTACYGGKPLAKQISRLREGVDVIVGTPGRILDLLNRRALSFDGLRWVVLDEADRMLDIGFRPDIEKILKRTPENRQTLLFSATLPQPVVRLAEKYMKEPEVLDFSNKGVAVETIEQYYVTVDPERKFDALVYLLKEQQPNQAIIFTRTKRGADRLARLLTNSRKFESLAAIHGDLSQGERDRVMSQFRAGTLRFLVATDVVGRGIDVSGISHIINYDIPTFCDDYVHRVGRTGRMGREGVAYTFVTVQEGSELTRIEMRIDKLLKRAELKGFESFTKPTDPNATLDDIDEPAVEQKPVYGKPTRKIRRAL